MPALIRMIAYNIQHTYSDGGLPSTDCAEGWGNGERGETIGRSSQVG